MDFLRVERKHISAFIEGLTTQLHIEIGNENPDAAHVDTWSRIYQYKDGAVNFNGCSVPQADKYLDQASVTADPQKSLALYVKAGVAYRDSLCWLNIADVGDTLVARAGLTGFEHALPWIYFTDFSKVTEKP
jgi:peptide/nickel transport system substrate-binding protein